MKTKILVIVLLLNSFWSIGQTKQVKVEGILEPHVNYQALSFPKIKLEDKYIGLFAKNGTFYLRETEVGFYTGDDDYSNESTSDYSLDAYDPSEEDGDDWDVSTLTFPSDDDDSFTDDEWYSDESTVAFIPSEGCLFLFVNFTGYNKAPFEAIYERYGIDMIPNKHFYYSFDYNNIRYTLQADGKKEDSDIKNYSLSFCKGDCQTKQVIFKHELIQDAMIKLLFIGDLDGDSEPDIILNAADNYENRRIMLFLSSLKQGKELLHLAAEKFDMFEFDY